MNTQKAKSIVSNSFLIFWIVLIAVLFMFYPGRISHLYGSSFANWHKFIYKFLQIDILFYIQRLAASFTGMICFALAATSLGSVFSKKHLSPRKTPTPQWLGSIITAFLLGEIVFSFILLTISILGKLSPIVTIIVLLAGGSLGIRSFKTLLMARQTDEKATTTAKATLQEKTIFWLSIAILTSTLFLTAARISYDSTAFYFSDAKIASMTNQLLYFPNDSFVVSSFHITVLYTALIQIAGDQAARFLSWINGLFIILLSLTLAEEMGLSRKGKLTALVLLLTSTAFTDLFGDGKIELATTLPAIASIYWLTKTEKEISSHGYLLSGVFAGFSIIARPYNAVLLGGFIALLFFTSKTSILSRAKHYLALSAPILILLALHSMANWLILGDFLAPLHNTNKVTPEIWQWSGFDPKNIWLARIFFPLTATFLNIPQSMGNISPLILMFIPMFFSAKLWKQITLTKVLTKASLIAFVILTTWVMIYFTIFEIRYVIFLWIIIYMASAEMINAVLQNSGTIGQKIILGIINLLLFYMVARNIFISIDAYAPIDKNNAPQCNDSMFCTYLWPLNQSANTGERVLGLSAFRYYLRPDLLACSSKADEYLIIHGALERSNEDFWSEVYKQGYTYIAYEENYSLRHLNIDLHRALASTPDWVLLEKRSETFEGYFSTYKIIYKDPPYRINMECSIDNGIWLVNEIP